MINQSTRTIIASGKSIGAKRAAALIAELDQAIAERDGHHDANRAAVATIATLESQLATAHQALSETEELARQLRQAVRHYGQHLDLCSLGNGGFCDCGYSAACRQPRLVLTTLDQEGGGNR